MVTHERNFHGLKPTVDLEIPNNAQLETAVADALAAAGGIDSSDIVVVEVEGKIFLKGTVSSAGQVSRAAEVAQSVAGVTEISNEVTVVAGVG